LIILIINKSMNKFEIKSGIDAQISELKDKLIEQSKQRKPLIVDDNEISVDTLIDSLRVAITFAEEKLIQTTLERLLSIIDSTAEKLHQCVEEIDSHIPDEISATEMEDLKIEQYKKEIVDKLSKGRHYTKISPKTQTLNVLASIYKMSEGARGRGILSVLTLFLETDEPLTAENLSEQTGYAKESLLNIALKLPRYLKSLPYEVIGDRESGWKIVKVAD
jgi:hypothetical protein